jgi:RNA polymerase sigma-70 factor (ECF subfamily)
LSGHDEKQLIQAAREGNRQAYAQLIDRYSHPVFGICYGILGNATDAEDAVQETLVKGFQAIEACRNGDSFGAWIGRIARNLCVDWVRQKKRHRVMLEEKTFTQQTTPAKDQNPDVEKYLLQLPVELRLPLVLFYFDGQNPRAIAEKLELSHTTVYQRLREARKELHRLMMDGGER